PPRRQTRRLRRSSSMRAWRMLAVVGRPPRCEGKQEREQIESTCDLICSVIHRQARLLEQFTAAAACRCGVPKRQVLTKLDEPHQADQALHDRQRDFFAPCQLTRAAMSPPA